MVPAASAVGIKISRFTPQSHEVLSGGDFELIASGRRNVVGRDRVPEYREHSHPEISFRNSGFH